MNPIDSFSLLGSGKRLIGWGASGLFRYYQTLYPLPLHYLIDSKTSLWGGTCQGLDIHQPEQLAKEDPKHTIIIIYSSFASEIEQQIRKYGSYTAITAPAFFCPERRYLKKVIENGDVDARLIIPQTYTRKYLPFSPSDLIMCGTTDVMQAYWNVALDPRRFNISHGCKTNSLAQISKAMLSTECYLGVRYARKLCPNVAIDLRDSWKFFQKHFIVVDNSWFKLFWVKNPNIPDTFPIFPYRENIDHSFWQSLFFEDEELILKEMDRVDIKHQKWS